MKLFFVTVRVFIRLQKITTAIHCMKLAWYVYILYIVWTLKVNTIEFVFEQYIYKIT